MCARRKRVDQWKWILIFCEYYCFRCDIVYSASSCNSVPTVWLFLWIRLCDKKLFLWLYITLSICCDHSSLVFGCIWPAPVFPFVISSPNGIAISFSLFLLCCILLFYFSFWFLSFPIMSAPWSASNNWNVFLYINNRFIDNVAVRIWAPSALEMKMFMQRGPELEYKVVL